MLTKSIIVVVQRPFGQTFVEIPNYVGADYAGLKCRNLDLSQV